MMRFPHILNKGNTNKAVQQRKHERQEIEC